MAKKITKIIWILYFCLW